MKKRARPAVSRITELEIQLNEARMLLALWLIECECAPEGPQNQFELTRDFLRRLKKP